MAIARILIAAILFWGLDASFKGKLKAAAATGDLEQFAAARRWQARYSIVLWSLIAVWLYIEPQYGGFRHIVSWVIVVSLILRGIVELKMSGSPASNQRYAAQLLKK